MVKWILRVKTALVKSLDFSVALVMAVLVLDVLWQVFTRYVLRSQSPWTSELATVLLVWVSLLGASVAFAHQGHLGVDYFVGKLPGPLKKLTEILVLLIVGLFTVSVMIYGGSILVANTDESSASLRINYHYLQFMFPETDTPFLKVNYRYVYLVLPISGFFILLFTVEMLAEKLGWVSAPKTADEVNTSA